MPTDPTPPLFAKSGFWSGLGLASLVWHLTLRENLWSERARRGRNLAQLSVDDLAGAYDIDDVPSIHQQFDRYLQVAIVRNDDLQTELAAAGVDEFWYEGMDVIAALAGLHANLGI